MKKNSSGPCGAPFLSRWNHWNHGYPGPVPMSFFMRTTWLSGWEEKVRRGQRKYTQAAKRNTCKRLVLDRFHDRRTLKLHWFNLIQWLIQAQSFRWVIESWGMTQICYNMFLIDIDSRNTLRTVFQNVATWQSESFTILPLSDEGPHTCCEAPRSRKPARLSMLYTIKPARFNGNLGDAGSYFTNIPTLVDTIVLWMEEILHHLAWLKSYK